MYYFPIKWLWNYAQNSPSVLSNDNFKRLPASTELHLIKHLNWLKEAGNLLSGIDLKSDVTGQVMFCKQF